MGANASWSSSYGAILDDLQGRRDLLERIKGCVFDSGGDRNINPKVWAAGFVAALLKKRSSATYPLVDAGEDHVLENGMTVSKMGQKEPLRLTKIISSVSKNQPPCPQLYLYSTADKVIP